MTDCDSLFKRLSQSELRPQFRLGDREQDYWQRQGQDPILTPGADFIAQRLAPAHPPNDGRQTPRRGHPRVYPAPAVGDASSVASKFRQGVS